MKNRTYNRKKLLVVFGLAVIVLFLLAGRLVYLMVFEAGYYQEKAQALHEREREIRQKEGRSLTGTARSLPPTGRCVPSR